MKIVRDRIPVEKRKPLTRRESLELMLRQEGKCGCGCGEKLAPMTEGVIDEHINPLGITGTNDLSNRALYRKPCATLKTKRDAANKAKCDRIIAREEGTRRERQPIPQRANPWPPKGSRALQSRSGWKEKRT